MSLFKINAIFLSPGLIASFIHSITIFITESTSMNVSTPLVRGILSPFTSIARVEATILLYNVERSLKTALTNLLSYTILFLSLFDVAHLWEQSFGTEPLSLRLVVLAPIPRPRPLPLPHVHVSVTVGAKDECSTGGAGSDGPSEPLESAPQPG